MVPASGLRTGSDIEQFRTVVGQFLRGGQQTPSLPTIVFAFDDKQSLQPFVPLFDGKPVSLGGYCQCGSGSSELNRRRLSHVEVHAPPR